MERTIRQQPRAGFLLCMIYALGQGCGGQTQPTVPTGGAPKVFDRGGSDTNAPLGFRKGPLA